MLFQSTRPRGARRRQTPTYSFNPRARAGRDCIADVHSRFNPRARAGRDVVPWYVGRDVDLGFQSTRPRGARRDCAACSDHRSAVSIHAPARGATSDDSTEHHGIRSFQSTRPRGARRHGHQDMPNHVIGFNPRARAGRDYASHRHSRYS